MNTQLLTSWSVGTALAIVCAANVSADVIHVNAAASKGGDGSSWALAFADLQDALAIASDGDDIWVASGIYVPTNSPADRDATFQIPGGVWLLGGFAGHESNAAERDPQANPTVLSGDVLGDDACNFMNRSDNVYTVVTVVDTDDAEVLIDGFTIRGGNCDQGAGAPEPTRQGGGIWAHNATLTLVRCDITDNTGTSHSAAYIRVSTVAITDSNVRRNHASGVVGGISLSGCIFELDRVNVRDNESVEAVGGMSIGAYVGNFGSINIPTCGSITNCQFLNNKSNHSTGGLLMTGGSGTCTLKLINCVFASNQANLGGGANLGGNMDIINCTFVFNTGSGVELGSSNPPSPSIQNSIFWGHTSDQISHSDTDTQVSYSIVQGGWDGSGSNNIDAEPLFVAPHLDHYGLLAGSPGINAGTNLPVIVNNIDDDILGAPRIQDGIVDIGAYEGTFEPMDFTDSMDGICAGGLAFLVPNSSQAPERLEVAVVFLFNDTTENDQSATAVVLPESPNADAGGIKVFGRTMRLEHVSMPEGSYRATISIPFTADDLNGAAPESVYVAFFDESTGRHGAAVTGNADAPIDEPGFGTRSMRLDGGNLFGYVHETNKSGVYWDPDEQRGLAWAVVNYMGDFSLGTNECPGDIAQVPNGIVAIEDLVLIIENWGDIGGYGPADTNNDGTVNVTDLLLVISNWGLICP